MNPGQTLSLIRQIRGLSQADLARKIHVGRPLLSELENARRPLTQQYRDRLRAVGIDLDNDAITAAMSQLYEAVCGNAQPS